MADQAIFVSQIQRLFADITWEGRLIHGFLHHSRYLKVSSEQAAQ